MAYTPDFEKRRDDPAGLLSEMMKQGSPLMDQAKTAGLQMANQRGLLSSSMAVGAAQDAQVRAMVPLAQQQAAQGAQANLSRQDFEQGRTLQGDQITSQQTMQGRDIESREAMQGREIESRFGMQERDIAAQREAQTAQIAAQFGMQATDIAAQMERMQTDIAARVNLQAADIAAQRENQLRDIQARFGLQEAEAASMMERMEFEAQRANQLQQQQNAFDENMRQLDRTLQTQLADMNLSAEETRMAASSLVEVQRTYTTERQAIMSNTKLSSNARQEAMDAVQRREDLARRAALSLFSVEVDMPEMTAPPDAPPAPAPPPAPAALTPAPPATPGPPMSSPEWYREPNK